MTAFMNWLPVIYLRMHGTIKGYISEVPLCSV